MEKDLKKGTVLCSISTKDRYDSLAMTVQSVAMQTMKPDKLIIFDDGEQKDLRQDSTWGHLFHLLDEKKIEWEIQFGEKRGQVRNHQRANKSNYDFVWRLDDDEIAEPNVLKRLMAHMKPNVGAVGGAVVEPNRNQSGGTNKLIDIFSTPNLQWSIGKEVKEVEHLYSSFLYRPNIANYNLNLSPVCHREETLFSHELYRKGYKLIVDTSIVTWHLRQEKGGIRSHTDSSMYDYDEKIFRNKLKEWGYFLASLDCGIGDHYMFLNILPELQKKYKHIILGVCYPEVFDGINNIKLTSIGATKGVCGGESVYKWAIDNQWKGSLVEAFGRMYEVIT